MTRTKGSDLVTGKALNSWTNEDKDITMANEKGADPLQPNDPWAQARPESDEEEHDKDDEHKEKTKAANKDNTEVITPRVKRHIFCPRTDLANEGRLPRRTEDQPGKKAAT